MSANQAFQDLFKTITITLEPVTPIHVWSGRNAIVGVDALIQEQYFIVIELEESMKTLPEKSLEELASTFGRKDELANRLRQLYKEGLLVAKKIPVRTPIQGSQTNVRLLHENLVPGSELKGYIRTAVLKKLLKSNREPHKIIGKRVNPWRNPKHMGMDIEAQLLRSPRTKKQGGFMDALMMISVSDPLSIEGLQTSVRKLTVLKTSNLKPVASLYAVTFDQGVLRYEMSIRSFKLPETSNNIELPKETVEKMNSLSEKFNSKDWILEALGEMGCELIDIELEKIKDTQSLKKYYQILNDLKKELCSEDNKNQAGHCVPARIGFMTGHESKTLLPEIKRYHYAKYNAIKSVMGKRLRRPWDSLTVKLVNLDSVNELVGVGWCRLCLE
ncbi:MAG: type III-A CRISPR-associated RAMP protein Csm5 [Thermosphaera sp.]